MLTKLTEFTYVTLIKKRFWKELNGPYFSSANYNIFYRNTYTCTYLLRGQLWLGEGSIQRAWRHRKLSLTYQLSHHPGRRPALGGGPGHEGGVPALNAAPFHPQLLRVMEQQSPQPIPPPQHLMLTMMWSTLRPHRLLTSLSFPADSPATPVAFSTPSSPAPTAEACQDSLHRSNDQDTGLFFHGYQTARHSSAGWLQHLSIYLRCLSEHFLAYSIIPSAFRPATTVAAITAVAITAVAITPPPSSSPPLSKLSLIRQLPLSPTVAAVPAVLTTEPGGYHYSIF
jgi:hypothetical protein